MGEADRISLQELPDFDNTTTYKVDPYIAAAAKLQAAGREKALQTRRSSLLRSNEHQKSSSCRIHCTDRVDRIERGCVCAMQQ